MFGLEFSLISAQFYVYTIWNTHLVTNKHRGLEIFSFKYSWFIVFMALLLIGISLSDHVISLLTPKKLSERY